MLLRGIHGIPAEMLRNFAPRRRIAMLFQMRLDEVKDALLLLSGFSHEGVIIHLMGFIAICTLDRYLPVCLQCGHELNTRG